MPPLNISSALKRYRPAEHLGIQDKAALAAQQPTYKANAIAPNRPKDVDIFLEMHCRYARLRHTSGALAAARS